MKAKRKQVAIRLTQDEKVKLERMASNDGRTVSGFIRYLISKAVNGGNAARIKSMQGG
jgi:predicted DNA-binding protein